MLTKHQFALTDVFANHMTCYLSFYEVNRISQSCRFFAQVNSARAKAAKKKLEHLVKGMAISYQHLNSLPAPDSFSPMLAQILYQLCQDYNALYESISKPIAKDLMDRLELLTNCAKPNMAAVASDELTLSAIISPAILIQGYPLFGMHLSLSALFMQASRTVTQNLTGDNTLTANKKLPGGKIRKELSSLFIQLASHYTYLPITPPNSCTLL